MSKGLNARVQNYTMPQNEAPKQLPLSRIFGFSPSLSMYNNSDSRDENTSIWVDDKYMCMFTRQI